MYTYSRSLGKVLSGTVHSLKSSVFLPHISQPRCFRTISPDVKLMKSAPNLASSARTPGSPHTFEPHSCAASPEHQWFYLCAPVTFPHPTTRAPASHENNVTSDDISRIAILNVHRTAHITAIHSECGWPCLVRMVLGDPNRFVACFILVVVPMVHARRAAPHPC